MEGPTFEALVADIRANGLMNPITLCDDKLLDGRNRHRACVEAGVQPIFDVYDGPDPLAFVLSQNVERRHLDESQRGMIASRLATLRQGARTDLASIEAMSQPDAASKLNVSRSTVQRATTVLENANPIVVKAVDEGKMTVACAVEIIKLDLDAEDLSELVTLPSPDIPRNVERLKKEAKREETLKRIQAEAAAAPEWPQGRFSVFYADPAWEDDFGHTKKDVEHHYPTMTLDKIKALPVDEIATPDAVLYLWAPPHMVHKALEVMARWGFEYRSHMVWVKDRIGLGQWFRNRHEILLCGRRGDFPPPPEAVRSSSVSMCPQGEHSAKPEEFAELIENWYPDAAKVELFRRGPARPGWSVWGSEAKAAK